MNSRRIIQPIAFLALMLIAAAISTTRLQAASKQFVVVIDAGHGGHDAGAVGRKTKEKDIALAVAKKLGEKLKASHKNVKVVFTRTTDAFVTLHGRVQKGKDSNADLFISIHCNSAAKGNPDRTKASGTEVWVLGPDAADANLDFAIRENQSILLEKDHTTRYQGFDNSPEYYIFNEISQNRTLGRSYDVASYIQQELVSTAGLKDRGVKQTQKLFLLLHATVPTVLVELDFICNPDREAFLSSTAGQNQLAAAICNGVSKFRKTGLSTTGNESTTQYPADNDLNIETNNYTSGKATYDANDEIRYRIQFLVSGEKLSDNSKKFKGLSPVDYYVDGKTYKYVYGDFGSISEANSSLKQIRKKFSDAFIIKIQNGKRVR